MPPGGRSTTTATGTQALLGDQRFELIPFESLGGLAPDSDDPDDGIGGLHIYTFDQVPDTGAWRRERLREWSVRRNTYGWKGIAVSRTDARPGELDRIARHAASGRERRSVPAEGVRVAHVAKLGHVAVETPDLAESVWFFRDVMGLQEVEREGETVYLRGMRDWEHHTLSLTAGSDARIDHVGWRASSPEALDAVEAKLDAQAMESTRVAAGSETGVGEALRFRAPTGHNYELYYDVEKPDPPEDGRSKLPNRVYSPGEANRIAPRRIDHVHVQDPEGRRHTDWMCDTLGFGINELFRTADGEEWGWWISVTALPHDLGVHRYEEDVARFHHFSFHVEERGDLWDAADICREHGIPPDGGPGMHAITKADFFYVKDPASDVRIELFAGPGYLNFEPDWDPIVWEEETIGTAEDHQWIGTQYSDSGTHYAGDFLC